MSLQLFDSGQIDVTFEETSDELNSNRWWSRARVLLIGIVDNFTHLRVYRVSVVHWGLLILWSVFLLILTTVYSRMYARSALLATVCTNVLLYGISDILAQSIYCYLSYSIDPLREVLDTPFFISRLGSTASDEETLGNDGDDDNDSLSVFNDYGSPQPVGSRGLLYEAPDAAENHIFDFHRWSCFMLWGLILSFFQVPWYRILNYIYTEDPTIIQVLERVLSDQLLYSPVSLYCFFMYSNYITEAGDSGTFSKKIQKLFISTLGCNYLLWPMVQLINFSIVPKHLQVPFSSSIGILWNCFLSMRNSSDLSDLSK